MKTIMDDDERDEAAYWADDSNQDDEPGICPSCNGSGEGRFDGTTCHACKGKGEL